MPGTAADLQKDVKRKLTRVVRILEEKYGPHIYPEPGMELLEQIVFAILCDRNPVTNARKALRDMRDEYVDWNEVRVATIRQLEETLERARIEEPGRHAEVLKALLEKVFNEVCRVSLDGLRTDGPEKARKTVQKLDILEPHEQQYLLVGAGVEEGPPLDPATDRIGQRVGLFAPDDAPAKRRKVLESLVASQDALRFHHLMVEHGKKLCTDEDPYPIRCIRCPAQLECDFFKTREQQKKLEAKQQKERPAPEEDRAERAEKKGPKAAPAKGRGTDAKVKPQKGKKPASKRRSDEDE